MVRPADWIDTEYNNQSNSSAFWDLTVIDNVLEVISFSPVDNGTAASVTSNLEVLFDQVPVLLNGDVIIRVLRDDGAFETLDTNGTSITINGNGLNMRLPTPLDYNENYYIELGCGATGPVGGVPFPGFDDNGTWNFYSGIMDTDINFFEKTF